MIECNRCGKDVSADYQVDSPHKDGRVYCVECYASLFPPGWTDDYDIQPVSQKAVDYYEAEYQATRFDEDDNTDSADEDEDWDYLLG